MCVNDTHTHTRTDGGFWEGFSAYEPPTAEQGCDLLRRHTRGALECALVALEDFAAAE